MSYAELEPETRKIAERVLTRRQLDVFRLWMAGMSDHSISLTLDIATSTARGHRIRAIQLIEIEKRKVVV